MADRLTRARHGGLTILAHGPAHYSNHTAIERDRNDIYWQVADWLIEQGYATWTRDNERHDDRQIIVTITPAGRERLDTETTGLPKEPAPK